MWCQLLLALFLLYCTFLCSIVSSVVVSSSPETNNTILELKSQTNSINATIADKLKRLRLLRAEVKSLAAELRESKIEEIISDSKKESNSTGLAKKKHKKHWKRRIQKRIGRLSKRLSKLERAVIVQQESFKSTRGKHVRKIPTKSTTLPMAQNTTSIHHHQTKSRPGYHKSSCKIHNDCLPGHCCHNSGTESQCIRHALNETEICRHSCQCNSDMHCFRRKTDDANGQSNCKKVHISDVSLGHYENAKESVFNT